jgi:hypothetical protein
VNRDPDARWSGLWSIVHRTNQALSPSKVDQRFVGLHSFVVTRNGSVVSSRFAWPKVRPVRAFVLS